MKMHRKLIPAFALLLVSAIMLSTTSYAWFSMNKDVKATGMQVTAKSDSIYLLISSTKSTNTAIQAEPSKEATLSVKSQLLPAAPDTGKITNQETAAVVGNWYTASASYPDNSKINEGTKTSLDDGNFAQYVIKKTVYLTLAAGSEKAFDLKVKANKFAQTNVKNGEKETMDPVNVLICGPKANVTLYNKNQSSETVIADQVTADDVVKIDIYLYYNGNDESVFTNNIVNLEGADIELTFSVSSTDAG